MMKWLSVLAVAAVTIICCLILAKITGKERKVRIAGTFALISAGGFAYALSGMVQRGLDGGYLIGSVLVALTVPSLIFFVLYRSVKDKKGKDGEKVLKERTEQDAKRKEGLEKRLQEAVAERNSLREQVKKQKTRMRENTQAAGEKEEKMRADIERIQKESREEIERIKKEYEEKKESLCKEYEEERELLHKECKAEKERLNREHGVDEDRFRREREEEREAVLKECEAEKERICKECEMDKELLRRECEMDKKLLREEFEEEQERLRREYKEEQERLRRKCEEEQENLRRECEEERENLRRECEEEKERIYKECEMDKELFRKECEEEQEHLRSVIEAANEERRRKEKEAIRIREEKQFAFDNIVKKAETFRQRGMHSLAVTLYQQGIEKTESEEERKRMRKLLADCYIDAGEPGKARKVLTER